MRFWSKRQPPKPTPAPRFADLRAMTPRQREAAFAGPHAAAWIEAAANYGLVEAQLLHGQAHLAANPALALRWFRAAAGAGYAPARNMVGRCLENGWGATANLDEAARHYRMAAEQGHDWAQFNLANMLLYGLGLSRDRPAAYAWYANAAAQNHAKAMNMLGRFHEEGWDRPRHLPTALHWYRRAAQAGDCRAQFNLATILHQQGHTAQAQALLHSALATGHTSFQTEATAALAAHADSVELGNLSISKFRQPRSAKSARLAADFGVCGRAKAAETW